VKRKRKKNSGRSKKSTQVQEQQQTENSSTSPKRFFVTLIPEQARYQLLSWFGILGGAISILSHMEGVITLGKMAGYIIASWSSLLIFVWGKLLFFLPVIDITDASIFTVMSFAVINLGLSTSRNPSEQSRSLFYKLSVFLAGILLIGIFLGALFKKYGGAHRFLDSSRLCIRKGW
jgi:hypothetical protein